MPMKILLLASVGLAWPVAATADPLDCTDMEYAVQEILVERMQIPQFLGLDTAEAAGATFQMNYFHAERREYNRTFCSAIINLNGTRIAEAVRRSAEIKKMQLSRTGEVPLGRRARGTSTSRLASGCSTSLN